ncbi:MAG: SprT family zinc-dependent metalloprotease [Patescibacteria group bacterium]
MHYIIHVGEKKIIYTLRQSSRARHVRVTVHYNGNIVVTAPRRIDRSLVEQFIVSKSSWIREKLAHIQSLGYVTVRKIDRRDYTHYKISAKLIVENRLGYFNAVYGFSYGRVSIRNQTTRWGSCSGNGNLNFNYRIALLPPHLTDYIIVHELCHIAELNHSQQFWRLVAQTIPRYVEFRKELRRHGL